MVIPCFQTVNKHWLLHDSTFSMKHSIKGFRDIPSWHLFSPIYGHYPCDKSSFFFSVCMLNLTVLFHCSIFSLSKYHFPSYQPLEMCEWLYMYYIKAIKVSPLQWRKQYRSEKSFFSPLFCSRPRRTPRKMWAGPQDLALMVILQRSEGSFTIPFHLRLQHARPGHMPGDQPLPHCLLFPSAQRPRTRTPSPRHSAA